VSSGIGVWWKEEEDPVQRRWKRLKNTLVAKKLGVYKSREMNEKFLSLRGQKKKKVLRNWIGGLQDRDGGMKGE